MWKGWYFTQTDYLIEIIFILSRKNYFQVAALEIFIKPKWYVAESRSVIEIRLRDFGNKIEITFSSYLSETKSL